MTNWQNQRPPSDADASETDGLPTFELFKQFALEAQRTGVPHMIDDVRLDPLGPREVWEDLADQYRCDFTGPFCDHVEELFYYLLSPRKQGPHDVWIADVLYDTSVADAAVLQRRAEAWLERHAYGYRIAEHPDLKVLRITLRDEDEAMDMSRGLGGASMAARFFGNVRSRDDLRNYLWGNPDAMKMKAAAVVELIESVQSL